MNIPVRRFVSKHNFGSGAVKLPHSGVERKYIEPLPVAKLAQVGTSKNNYQENKAETKETRVVKSETKTVYTSHETNLNVLIIVAGGLAWFLFK